MTCMPTGIPSEKPTGMDIPGSPARLTAMVYMSDRYMAIGSALFSPKRKAVDGDVGPMITSTSVNARLKSSLINRLIFCALR